MIVQIAKKAVHCEQPFGCYLIFCVFNDICDITVQNVTKFIQGCRCHRLVVFDSVKKTSADSVLVYQFIG